VVVLVVEDCAFIRERLAAMVGEVPGVEVEQAADGEEALRIARRRLPGLVLLDLHLPDGGGLAVLPRIKALPSAPVVVVLTGAPTEHHRRQSLARGADFFLDKAGDFANVLAAVLGPTPGEPPSDASSLGSPTEDRASRRRRDPGRRP
jgi:DNA-binding response OmpR family regulator